MNEIESTLVLLKPDALRRGLIGQILTRYENRDLTITDLRFVTVTPELIQQHYAEHTGNAELMETLRINLAGREVLAVWLHGLNAIAIARAVNGKTNPVDAAPGTIRGDFGNFISQNLVHASDSPQAAEHELALWFLNGNQPAQRKPIS